MALLAAGCAGAGGTAFGGGDALNVLMVNNPQMVELQKLTAEHFTKETGIKVHFTVLPENDVRDKISQDFSNQAGQYDVATISNFEVPFFAKNGWLHPLDDVRRTQDTAFDQDDILEPAAGVADRRGRQALRRALLRRVVLPHVPQGRLRGEGADDARRTPPGRRSPNSRRRPTAPSPG